MPNSPTPTGKRFRIIELSDKRLFLLYRAILTDINQNTDLGR
jgi:hypothetical protein